MITIITSKRHQELLEAERRIQEIDADPKNEYVRAFGEAPETEVRKELAVAGAEVSAAKRICEVGSQVFWKLELADAALTRVAKALS